jgi:hypothetical protein
MTQRLLSAYRADSWKNTSIGALEHRLPTCGTSLDEREIRLDAGDSVGCQMWFLIDQLDRATLQLSIALAAQPLDPLHQVLGMIGMVERPLFA